MEARRSGRHRSAEDWRLSDLLPSGDFLMVFWCCKVWEYCNPSFFLPLLFTVVF